MYLSWKKQTITDFSDTNITSLYGQGYVFTRLGKGEMDQTRSVRIDLSKFKLNSENRRVLRKTENLLPTIYSLPLSDYHWSIGKLAKDFYTKKFGEGIFSANKIKELLTDQNKSNFNQLLAYSIVIPSEARGDEESLSKNSIRQRSLASLEMTNNEHIGYSICYSNPTILHYCYPFYQLQSDTSPLLSTTYSLPPNTGIGMMTKAIVWAQEQDKKYVYLGSAKDAASLYKFQFEGAEWFDRERWQTEKAELKKLLK